MSSRSATVLVIFIVACIAFCLATVFAAMTGPISILPNESDSGSVLDNLSVITDSDNYNYQSYGYDDSKSDSSSSDDSQSNEPNVETTTDDSSSADNNNKPSQEGGSTVKTTTDSQSGGSSESNPTNTK